MESSSEMMTEEEMEVAAILEELTYLFMESRRDESGLPLALHWGSKRKRSAGHQSSSSHPVIPHLKSAARSPTSPLSFYPSGGEEAPAAAVKRPLKELLLPPPAKPFKNAKGHKEWVKQQNQTIATLSAHKVNIERAIMEAKRRQQELKARNLSLREIRDKMESGMVESRTQQQQQPSSVSVRPTNLQPAAAAAPAHCNPSTSHHQQWRAFMVGMTRPAMAAVPDLNSVAEEEGLELGLGLGLHQHKQQQQQQQESMAYKAAMSAQARKRRIELQREKSLSSAFSHPHVMYKIPRLR